MLEDYTEISQLKEENKLLVEQIECLRQKEYETRQKLNKHQSMNSELESEIEKLEEMIKDHKNQLQIQNQECELIKQLKSKVLNLEMMLEEKDDSLNSALKKIEEKQTEKEQISVVVEKDESTTNNNFQELIQELSEKCDQYKKIIEESKTNEINSKREIKELKSNLDEMTSLFNGKVEDHRSSLHIIQSLQEEKMLMNVELASLKAPASDMKTRGNSLFAEVEDNRQKVMSKMEVLKNKYTTLKNAFSLKSNECRRLKTENFNLVEELKNEKMSEYWNKTIAGYEERISDLQEQANYYSKRPENPQVITIDLENLSWVNTIIDEARKETNELRKEMESRSLKHFGDFKEQCRLIKENRELHYQNKNNTAIIEDLTSQLKESNRLVSDLKEGNSHFSPVIDLEQPNMESKQKTVRFADDI
uniref:Uncharacterized protein n=1 Tax=Clastoptera arizonana TaxID=38151 RepID=A0A1B6CB80_9HEMI